MSNRSLRIKHTLGCRGQLSALRQLATTASKSTVTVVTGITCALAAPASAFGDDLTDSLPTDVTRPWISGDFFTNRLQDWQLNNGRIECIESRRIFPLRTVQVLTRALSSEPSDFEIRVTTGPIDAWDAGDGERWAGFIIGAGGEHVDYRISAMVHHRPAEDGGLLALIDETGRVMFRDNSQGGGGGTWAIGGAIETTDVPEIEASSRSGEGFGNEQPESIVLTLRGGRTAAGYALMMHAADATGDLISSATMMNPDPSMLDGGTGLVAHRAQQWFEDFSVTGDRVAKHNDRVFGPFVTTMHTMSNGTLKLTAQMMPLSERDIRTASLQIRDVNGEWSTVAHSQALDDCFTIPFRVEEWDSSRNTPYRITFAERMQNWEIRRSEWHGTIHAEPKDEPVAVAVFTGTKHYTGGLKWNHNGIWFPHNEVAESVRYHNPDVLFFSGDQVYEGDITPAQTNPPDKARLDYLYKWYRWCWAFRDLTRDIPCVAIPDDHDVYHGNIWGAGGIRAVARDGMTAQDAGGYKMPPRFVNMVHRTQTSHLPDPYDTAPCEQGITVYYTEMIYGGVSFAVIADRQWKSSASVMVPEGQCVNGWFQNPDFDPVTQADVPGAVMLGARQLAFLHAWAISDSGGAWMKVALSQTPFVNLATIPKDATSGSASAGMAIPQVGEYVENQKLAADTDSGGWPQTGRNRAVEALRKAGAIHLAGDQHLGALIEYGVEDWRDGGFAFSAPSIANTWPRRWYPPMAGENREPDSPKYTGDFFDGFGNRVTVYAVSNPEQVGHEPARLYNAAPGYGIVRMDPATKQITFECWPRWVDPSAPGATQYPGWPKTIHVDENR